jgi:hypothetical protein
MLSSTVPRKRPHGSDQPSVRPHPPGYFGNTLVSEVPRSPPVPAMSTMENIFSEAMDDSYFVIPEGDINTDFDQDDRHRNYTTAIDSHVPSPSGLSPIEFENELIPSSFDGPIPGFSGNDRDDTIFVTTSPAFENPVDDVGIGEDRELDRVLMPQISLSGTGGIIGDPKPAPPEVRGSLQPDAVPKESIKFNDDVWGRHKRLIEILYATEGLSLKSVMRIMETAGFLVG